MKGLDVPLLDGRYEGTPTPMTRAIATISVVGVMLLLAGCSAKGPTIAEARAAVNAYLGSKDGLSDLYWEFRNACDRSFQTERNVVQGADVISVGEMQSLPPLVGGTKKIKSWPVAVKVHLLCGEEGAGHSLTIEHHWSLYRYPDGWRAYWR